VPALLGDAGEVRAAAPLALRRRAGLVQFWAIGHTGLDRAPVVSRHTSDAAELALQLASILDSMHRPWTLLLRQLPPGCGFAGALAQRLATVELRPGSGRPLVHLDGARDPHSALSRNQRRAEAKARNRIAAAGLTLEPRWTVDPMQVAQRIPEIRAVHRARDLQLRGTSRLDDPEEGAFYDALVRRHQDVLELLELRLGDALAAYLLWVRNGRARLVLDNRVAPQFTQYSAGTIANNIALQAAASDPQIDILDWGAGAQRYKLESANEVVPHEELMAWSSASARQVLTARRRLVEHTLRRTRAQ
jgi:hypothetical protein